MFGDNVRKVSHVVHKRYKTMPMFSCSEHNIWRFVETIEESLIAWDAHRTGRDVDEALDSWRVFVGEGEVIQCAGC